MAGRPIFRTVRHSLAFIVFVVVAAIALLAGFVIVDNSRVSAQHINVTLPVLPSQLEGYTILTISDLHGRMMGEQQATILNAVKSQRFDAVAILGDMLSPSGDTEAFYSLLEGLAAYGKPVYFIAGDEDVSVEGEREGGWDFSDWVKGAQERGARLLNKPVALVESPVRIWLMPGLLAVTDVAGTLQSLQSAYNDVIADKTLSAAERERRMTRQRMGIEVMTGALEALDAMQPGDVVVGAAHYPLTQTFVNDLLATNGEGEQAAVRLDLILAGHYCGGGVRVPLAGPMHVPAPRLSRGGWWPNGSEAEGLSQLGTMQQVITPGLGVSRDQKPFRFRAFNTPGVTFVRFTTKW